MSDVLREQDSTDDLGGKYAEAMSHVQLDAAAAQRALGGALEKSRGSLPAPVKRMPVWQKALPAAACLVLVLVLCTALPGVLSQRGASSETGPEPPTVNEAVQAESGESVQEEDESAREKSAKDSKDAESTASSASATTGSSSSNVSSGEGQSGSASSGSSSSGNSASSSTGSTSGKKSSYDSGIEVGSTASKNSAPIASTSSDASASGKSTGCDTVTVSLVGDASSQYWEWSYTMNTEGILEFSGSEQVDNTTGQGSAKQDNISFVAKKAGTVAISFTPSGSDTGSFDANIAYAYVFKVSKKLGITLVSATSADGDSAPVPVIEHVSESR